MLENIVMPQPQLPLTLCIGSVDEDSVVGLHFHNLFGKLLVDFVEVVSGQEFSVEVLSSITTMV